MKKIMISLIALGALSGVALADSNSEYDREGIDQNFGLSQPAGNGAGNTQALAAPAGDSGLTTFQKVIMSGKGDGSDR